MLVYCEYLKKDGKNIYIEGKRIAEGKGTIDY